MNKSEFHEQVTTATGRRIMMATKAFHPGTKTDISCDTPDPCIVSGESPDYYIGSWVLGIGFFGVVFPKATTRRLTAEEVAEYDAKTLCLSGQGGIKLDCEYERPLTQLSENPDVAAWNEAA